MSPAQEENASAVRRGFATVAEVVAYREAVRSGWSTTRSPADAADKARAVKFRSARRWVAAQAGVLALLLTSLLWLAHLLPGGHW